MSVSPLPPPSPLSHPIPHPAPNRSCKPKKQQTYLFRSACSELRTELQNARTSTSDTLRTQRTHLQYEVDILNQKLTQDLLACKDDLKGLFNDRKMAVRMDQRAMESAIQELNYKITVALNSDSKGEVEGLRWVLTRRAALAIVGMARMLYLPALLPCFFLGLCFLEACSSCWRWLVAPCVVCAGLG